MVGFIKLMDAAVRERFIIFLGMEEQTRRMAGRARSRNAQLALQISDELIEAGIGITLTNPELSQFLSSREYFACQLDGQREVIEHGCRAYFLNMHLNGGGSLENFTCIFSNKRSGDQSGVVALVGSLKYYVKTHQHGPTLSNPRSVARPDVKEVFIYTLLELMGVGPRVHFILPIHGLEVTLYIATEETLFVHLNDLTENTASITGLLELDLIARILCLSDCTTNGSNCGQAAGNPVVVDFRIMEREDYGKSDIYNRFLRGNQEYNYTSLMLTAVSSSDAAKRSVAKGALQKWCLNSNITLAEKRSLDVMSSLHSNRSEEDLTRYIRGLRKTLNHLTSSIQ